jgi:hypothetical protein
MSRTSQAHTPHGHRRMHVAVELIRIRVGRPQPLSSAVSDSFGAERRELGNGCAAVQFNRCTHTRAKPDQPHSIWTVSGSMDMFDPEVRPITSTQRAGRLASTPSFVTLPIPCEGITDKLFIPGLTRPGWVGIQTGARTPPAAGPGA